MSEKRSPFHVWLVVERDGGFAKVADATDDPEAVAEMVEAVRQGLAKYGLVLTDRGEILSAVAPIVGTH